MAETTRDITVHVDTTELDAAIEKAKLLISLLERAEQMSNSANTMEPEKCVNHFKETLAKRGVVR